MRAILDSLLRDSYGYIAGCILAAIAGFFGRKIRQKGAKMLEGKEVEVPIGNFGSASLDINDKLEVEVSVSAKIDLLAELHKLAEKTGTKLDDAVVDAISKLVGKA